MDAPRTLDEVKAELTAMLPELRRRWPVASLGIFGSWARGEQRPDSDLDLLVVVDDDAPRERLGWQGIYEARRGYHEPVDLVPWPRSAFDERRAIVGSLPWTVEQEGIVVFERG